MVQMLKRRGMLGRNKTAGEILDSNTTNFVLILKGNLAFLDLGLIFTYLGVDQSHGY